MAERRYVVVKHGLPYEFGAGDAEKARLYAQRTYTKPYKLFEVTKVYKQLEPQDGDLFREMAEGKALAITEQEQLDEENRRQGLTYR